jgi:hypothetical protein
MNAQEATPRIANGGLPACTCPGTCDAQAANVTCTWGSMPRRREIGFRVAHSFRMQTYQNTRHSTTLTGALLQVQLRPVLPRCNNAIGCA